VFTILFFVNTQQAAAMTTIAINGNGTSIGNHDYSSLPLGTKYHMRRGISIVL